MLSQPKFNFIWQLIQHKLLAICISSNAFSQRFSLMWEKYLKKWREREIKYL